MKTMKQMRLSESGFERKTKRTRKREFLDEMNLVVPWAERVSLIAPYAPAPGAKGGCPPFAVQTMLRIHFLQQWFNRSDPALEEALYDTLDGAQAAFEDGTGMSAPANCQRAAKGVKIGLQTRCKALKFPSFEKSRIRPGFDGCCADLS